jgi:hypothetical protein
MLVGAATCQMEKKKTAGSACARTLRSCTCNVVEYLSSACYTDSISSVTGELSAGTVYADGIANFFDTQSQVHGGTGWQMRTFQLWKLILSDIAMTHHTASESNDCVL